MNARGKAQIYLSTLNKGVGQLSSKEKEKGGYPELSCLLIENFIAKRPDPKSSQEEHPSSTCGKKKLKKRQVRTRKKKT